MTRRVGWAIIIALTLINLTSGWLRLGLYLDPRTTAVAALTTAVLDAIAFEVAAIVGVLIVARHPRHAVGRLLVAIGVSFAALLFLKSYARAGLLLHSGQWPGSVAAAWVTEWSYVPIFALTAALGLVFPDGRLPSRRWRPAAWGLVASTSLLLLSLPFVPGPLTEGGGAVDNPVAAPPALSAVVTFTSRLGYAGTLASMAISAAALVVRWRAADPVHRQQLSWIALGGAFVPPGVLALALVGGSPVWGPWIVLYRDVVTLCLFVAIGIAVLRHRLYDVTVVVNRAAAYGTLVVLVTAIYVVAAFAAAEFVDSDGPAFAAIAVALLLAPARTWSHRFANRLVYGETRAPYDVLRDLAHHLAGAPPADHLLPAIARTAVTGVRGVRAEIVLHASNGVDDVVRWPGDEPPGGDAFRTPIVHSGVEIGALSVTPRPGAPLTRAQRHLLETLSAQAAPALRNVRLTNELHRQLATVSAQAAELRASSQRLATAQADERRRFERDLHDGAQQQLLSSLLRLRLATATVDSAPARATALLDDVHKGLSDTLGCLRELARGVFPPVLASAGLGVALTAHVDRTGAPVTVHDRLPDGRRFHADVELAVYFACLEAIQNVTKHATTRGEVTLQLGGDGLTFEVADRGPGFDPVARPPGTGLVGIADRLGAVGGAVTVDSAVGRGTTVRGSVRV